MTDLTGTEGNDTLRGGHGNDRLYGGAGDDTLTGSSGHDILVGGEGNDRLHGGPGSDIYVFAPGHGHDTIAFGGFTWGDRIDLSAFTGITEIGHLTIRAEGNDTVIDLTDHGGGTIRIESVSPDSLADGHFVFYGIRGGAGDDTLTGTDGDDLIVGYAGDDVLEGGAGDDTLQGGAGEDTFVYGPDTGNDTIEDFAIGQDVIDLSQLSGVSGFGDLSITADGDDAVIDLSAYGGGTIRLEGVNPADLSVRDFVFPAIHGDDGANTIYGDDSDNVIYGHGGSDTIFAAGGDDVVEGGAGNDILIGGAGDDVIRGGAGDDYLSDGVGDDILIGGAGDDTLFSRDGADIFVFEAGHGHDTIKCFTNGDDRIDLSAFTGIAGFGDLTATQQGDDVKIDLSAHGGGTITLNDFSLDDLDASDFVFHETPVEGM